MSSFGISFNSGTHFFIYSQFKSNLLLCNQGLNILCENGAVSVPVPAPHCQLPLFTEAMKQGEKLCQKRKPM